MLKAIPLFASVLVASAANAEAPILNLDSKNKIKDEYIVVFKDKATNVEAFSSALNGGNAKVIKSFSNALR